MKDIQTIRNSIIKFLESENIHPIIFGEDEHHRIVFPLTPDTKKRERLISLEIQTADMGKCSHVFVHTSYTFPFSYEERYVGDLKSLLLFINQNVLIPGFGLDEGASIISFSYPFFLGKDLNDIPIFFSLIGSIGLNLDLFGPAIEEIAFGRKTFVKFIEAMAAAYKNQEDYS